MKPKFFQSQDKFREWLEANHKKKDELLVGFYKVGSGKDSMAWSESVDQALCFGWIDGVRKKYDDQSYTIRFTPRRERSTWSSINIAKVAELKKKGLMKPAGMAAFEKRRESNSAIYAYENITELSNTFEKIFKRNKAAWKFFQEQAAGYRRLCAHHVMTAKQEKTRISRLKKLIASSEEGKQI